MSPQKPLLLKSAQCDGLEQLPCRQHHRPEPRRMRPAARPRGRPLHARRLPGRLASRLPRPTHGLHLAAARRRRPAVGCAAQPSPHPARLAPFAQASEALPAMSYAPRPPLESTMSGSGEGGAYHSASAEGGRDLEEEETVRSAGSSSWMYPCLSRRCLIYESTEGVELDGREQKRSHKRLLTFHRWRA